MSNNNIKLDNYSWKEALTWGYCRSHLKLGFSKNKAMSARGRTIHILIGIAEALPIIGQISSLTEKLIASKTVKKPTISGSIHLTPSNIETVTKVSTAASDRIKTVLKEHGATDRSADEVVAVIKEIVEHSTIFGKPVSYDEEGVAYLRKNERMPFTLEAHKDGAVYVHFKSKAANQQDLLGQACQKKVYRAINQVGELVAACVMHEWDEDKNLTTFENERLALEKFKGCKYVLQGFHATKYEAKRPDEQKYGLIIEYCDGIADEDFLDTLPPERRMEFFLNILEGVQGMHQRGYSHCDLKSDNIMYKKNGDQFEPRIIDFGVMLSLDQELEHTPRGAVLPPEMRVHETFPQMLTEKVDVWSLGWYAATTILRLDLDVKYEILTDENGHYSGKRPSLEVKGEVPEGMEEFAAVIMQMLDCNPDRRLSLSSAREALQDLA